MSTPFEDIIAKSGIPDPMFPYSIEEENIWALYMDRMYQHSSSSANCTCSFCNDFNPDLIYSACGHTLCLRCVFEDLPALSVYRCPLCCTSLNKYVSKVTTGSSGSTKCVSFSFSPTAESCTKDADLVLPMSTFPTGVRVPTGNIYPILTIDTATRSKILSSVVMCRFHKLISPFPSSCSFECTVENIASLKTHMEQCISKQSGATHDSGLSPVHVTRYVPSGRDKPMPYVNNFSTFECVRLFSYPATAQSRVAECPTVCMQNWSKYIQGQKAISVAPYRNLVLAHVILRPFIIDTQSNPVFHARSELWNVQVVCFTNPACYVNTNIFTNITLGLDIGLPNGLSERLEFWIDPNRSKKSKVNRFYLRVVPRISGKYTFDLRWSCSMSDSTTDGMVTIQSRRLRTVYASNVIVDERRMPIRIQKFLEDLRPKISPVAFTNLQVAVATLNNGVAATTNSSAVTGDAALTLTDIQALVTYALLATTVQDACTFFFGCRGHLQTPHVARLFLATSVLSAVVHLMDRYVTVYVVQWFAVDMLARMQELLPEFHVMTIKQEGLIDRLRRVKLLFKRTKNPRLDDLLDSYVTFVHFMVPVRNGAEYSKLLTQKDGKRCITDDALRRADVVSGEAVAGISEAVLSSALLAPESYAMFAFDDIARLYYCAFESLSVVESIILQLGADKGDGLAVPSGLPAAGVGGAEGAGAGAVAGLRIPKDFDYELIARIYSETFGQGDADASASASAAAAAAMTPENIQSFMTEEKARAFAPFPTWRTVCILNAIFLLHAVPFGLTADEVARVRLSFLDVLRSVLADCDAFAKEQAVQHAAYQAAQQAVQQGDAPPDEEQDAENPAVEMYAQHQVLEKVSDIYEFLNYFAPESHLVIYILEGTPEKTHFVSSVRRDLNLLYDQRLFERLGALDANLQLGFEGTIVNLDAGKKQPGPGGLGGPPGAPGAPVSNPAELSSGPKPPEHAGNEQEPLEGSDRGQGSDASVHSSEISRADEKIDDGEDDRSTSRNGEK